MYNKIKEIKRSSTIVMTVLGDKNMYKFATLNGEIDLRCIDRVQSNTWYGAGCDTIAEYKEQLKNDIDAGIITTLEVINR